jgi:ankyrin repeat protein
LEIGIDIGHYRSTRNELSKVYINLKDKFRLTALYKATLGGHSLVIGLLLEKGASVYKKSKTRLTALHFVARRYDKVIVELLISRGADICVEASRNRMTPLHLAS